MQELEISWPDGTARFTVADSPIRIGRSSEAAIPLTASSVSRRHLTLTWNGTTWVGTDESTHGTFDPIGVKLAPEWNLLDETTVRLGGPEGVEVHISALTGSDPTGGGVDVAAPEPGGRSTTPAMEGAESRVGSILTDGPVAIDAEAQIDADTDIGAAMAESSPADEQSADEPLGGGLLDKYFAPSVAPTPVAEQSEPLFPSRAPSHSVLDDPAPSFGAGEQEVLKQAPRILLGDQGPPVEPADGDAGLLNLEAEPPAGPTGAHASVAIGPNSTIISDSTLRLTVAGQDYSFLPGAEVTVGRDPACLVHLDERHSLVSRRHLRIAYERGGWWLEDLSSKGTYVDGRPLKKPYKAEGAFVAHLGGDEAGTPLRVITAGDHRSPRNRVVLLVAALLAAAIALLAVVAFLLTRGDGSTTEPDLESAKLSTVMLFGLDGGQGSGFFVSDDLILTNQHVAVLSPQMLVGVSREPDQPAVIEYATELVANHPYLDLAVLRVSNKVNSTDEGQSISSEPVGDIGVSPVSIGDSADVTIGDRVFNTGFPGRLSITSSTEAGDLRLPAVVATSGEAANFSIWPGCSNRDIDKFIPDDSPPGVACSPGGDLDGGVMLASFFSSGQGSSGSAVFHDNQVVAVVYAGADDEDNATLAITSAVFDEWLEGIIDQNP